MNPLMMAMQGANARPANNTGEIGNIVKMLRSGNPEQIAMNLMQKNPQFRQFIEQNKGKTPEQVARENGIDLSKVVGQLK